MTHKRFHKWGVMVPRFSDHRHYEFRGIPELSSRHKTKSAALRRSHRHIGSMVVMLPKHIREVQS